ncbi:MAG: mechanosensitive ion channel domain-containing protein [Pseudomonadota bacterium]
MKDVLVVVGRVLNYKLFELAGTTVTVSTLGVAVLVLVLARLLSVLLQKVAAQGLARRGLVREGTVIGVQRLLHYTVMVIGAGVALDMLGIKLATLFAAGAIFAIGLGFAMQNIAQNFVSGLILLIERLIKPGDIIEVDGQVVRIIHMGIRSTLVRSRDEVELIVPNSMLVQTTVKNFTSRDSIYRLRCLVGVVYSADLRLTMQVLRDASKALDWRLVDREPRVLLVGFGSSSVDFEISVWVDDPWKAPQLLSKLNEAVWWALKDAAVIIAFPQLDLHLDPAVEQALLAGRGPATPPSEAAI